MANLIPGAYRGVAVSDVDVALDAASLVDHFTGREAYRRTRWIVAVNGTRVALVAVKRDDPESLFAPITHVELLAGPEEACLLHRPDIDTAIPSQLAVATTDPAAEGARCVIVHGRYGHVSFILDPRPVRVTVVEVTPPWPAKLLEQAQRVLDVAEHLPPILLSGEHIGLEDVAPPNGAVLLPCRGADIAWAKADLSFLDQRPPYRDWTLLGCARSREIHSWFYGREPAATVDLCPRHLGVDATSVLTKCCLLETGIQVAPGKAVVPWGASLDHIAAALAALAEEAEPHWAPA